MGRGYFFIRSKFNWLLGQMENHDEQLDLVYEDMLRQLRNAQLGLRDVVSVKHRMMGQRTELIRTIPELEEQARKAASADRLDLARRLVERRVLLSDRLARQQDRIAALDEEQTQLIQGVEVLTQRVENMRELKLELRAELRSAEAKSRIAASVTGLGDSSNDAKRIIERARETITQKRSEASAVDELLMSGALTDVMNPTGYIDAELKRLTASAKVEDEMSQLRELAPGEPTKEVTRGGD
jgi:phage shock protein A